MPQGFVWQHRLEAAIAFRDKLREAGQPGDNVFRLCAGAAEAEAEGESGGSGLSVAADDDSCAGVIIDQLGEVIWCRVLNPHWAARAEELMRFLVERFPHHQVCLAVRSPSSDGKSNSFVWSFSSTSPAKDVVEAQENGARFLVATEPCADLAGDFGLYVDSRAARLWVAAHASGLKVLNLYSYTCAFGVAARNGQARSVTNVDVSREALTWGKRNAALNQCDFSVVPEDAVRYVERLHSRIRRQVTEAPDLVLIDAPAFVWGRGQERLLRHALPRLLVPVFEFLPAAGMVLLSCNDRYLSEGEGQRVQALVAECAAKARRRVFALPLQQTADVLGQNPRVLDPWYRPPLFWVLRS